MLTIRDVHVDNHFSDKFDPLCHVGYFINGNKHKLMDKYIVALFTLYETKFCIFMFEGCMC